MFKIKGVFQCILNFAVCLFISPVLLIIVWINVVIQRLFKNKNQLKVAFFHPYCNDGGGGERVLWSAVHMTQNNFPQVHLTIYTGDKEFSPQSILSRVEQRFNIKLRDGIQFVYLNLRDWVEAKKYPHFTLLGQSLGSVLLGAEALLRFRPDTFIDTMGYAFTYPVFKYIGSCTVVSYTHYPIITTEMMSKISSREQSHNNDITISQSNLLSSLKLFYYKIFSVFYGLVGGQADVVMVNSSWTRGHIVNLWNSNNIQCVYPPCDVTEFSKIDRNNLEVSDFVKIISIGQFRPEKNHSLQVKALHSLKKMLSMETYRNVILIFIGACRNKEDEFRVSELQELSKTLEVEDNVVFRINITYKELKEELMSGTIGIHSMWNEHFGIGVVELMAAGLLTIAHSSGGPRDDIIEHNKTGFLAESPEEYAQTITKILDMNHRQRLEIINCARTSVNRFSTRQFEDNFLRTVKPYME